MTFYKGQKNDSDALIIFETKDGQLGWIGADRNGEMLFSDENAKNIYDMATPDENTFFIPDLVIAMDEYAHVAGGSVYDYAWSNDSRFAQSEEHEEYLRLEREKDAVLHEKIQQAINNGTLAEPPILFSRQKPSMTNV
jgi:hypothetical protein